MGKTVQVPTYDFATHTRTAVTEERVPRKIILVEGILIFTDPELVKDLDLKVFVVRFIVGSGWLKVFVNIVLFVPFIVQQIHTRMPILT